jgi:mono/diheme cytochrome c family protein
MKVLVCALLLTGCDWSLERMVDQDRCAPGEPTAWFANGECAQPRPDGVVRFGAAPSNAVELTGLAADGREVASIPVPVTETSLAAGQRRYELFCGPCHGLTGEAHTNVAAHMALRPPPSLHEARIVAQPDGHLFRVISGGYGLMPSYARALEPSERWQVVAYVRVLEQSQRATLSELPEPVRKEALSWLR